jgi:hypothetical protein
MIYSIRFLKRSPNKISKEIGNSLKKVWRVGCSTVDVCAWFAQSEEAPTCSLDSALYFHYFFCHSLVSSAILGTQILWRLQSVCRQLPRFAPTSRIVLSFLAAIIYFVFCSFIFNPTLAASLSNAK